MNPLEQRGTSMSAGRMAAGLATPALLATVLAYTVVGWVAVAGASLFQILLIVTIFLAVVSRGLALRIEMRLLTGLLLPAVIFVVCCLLSLVGSTDPTRGIAYVQNWMGSIGLLFVTAAIARTPAAMRSLALVLMGTTITGALLSILQAYVSAAFSLVPDLGHPLNHYAAYFRAGTVLQRPTGWSQMGFEIAKDMMPGAAIGLALTVSRARNLLGFVAWLVGVVAIALSGLRSGLLGMTAASVLVGAWYARKRAGERSVRVCLALATAAMVATVVLIGLERIDARIGERAGANLRVAQLLSVVSMIDHHPVAGVGIGSVGEQFERHFPRDSVFGEIDPRRNIPPHNVYAEVVAGAGPLALLALVWVLVEGFRNAVWAARHLADRELAAIAVGVAGALVGVVIDYAFHNHAFENHLWLLLGMTHALWALAQKGTA